MKSIRRPVVVLATGLLVAGWLLQSIGQEPPRRRYLPPEWQKVELTKDQQKRLLDIREEYGKKLYDLERKLSETKAAEWKDKEAVLTDEQRKKLKAIHSDYGSSHKFCNIGLNTQLTDCVLLWSCAKDGTRPLMFVFEQWRRSNEDWPLVKLRTPSTLIAPRCFVGCKSTA